MFRSFIKDPLFHFLVVALFIYLLQTALNPKPKMQVYFLAKEDIVNSSKLSWKKEWGRPPTKVELDALLEKKSFDEMLFKEALSMQLHRSDAFVYDKLVTRAKKLICDMPVTDKPTKKELHSYYDKHLDDYRKDGVFSFSHIFISLEQTNPIDKANKLLTLLEDSGVLLKEIGGMGDSFKQKHFKNLSKQEIVKLFGDSFYKQLSRFRKNQWQEPIISSLGVHLVYISEHSLGEVMPFLEIKDIVLSDFMEDKKEQYCKKKLKTLKDKYGS